MTLKFTSLFLVLGLAQSVLSQSTYKNGYLSTGSVSKSGVAAPAGYTWSEVQNDAGVTTMSNANAGISAFINATGLVAFSIADDFTVPVGEVWSVSGINVYGYQGNPATTPIDRLHFRIWDGPPDVATSTVVFGDMSTNRLSGSTDSLMYRIFNSLYPAPFAPTTDRKVWRFSGAGDVMLQSGTYWLQWNVHAIDNGTVFFPANTVVGSRGLAGWNAKRYDIRTNTWANTIDLGDPQTAADVPLDFPFEINYTQVIIAPVKLLSFAGKGTAEGNMLHWKTADEVNFSAFEIQRSTDGLNFDKIAVVQAKGGVAESTYELTDVKVQNNTNYYYRLKQVDKDGTFTYSKVVLVKTTILKDNMWVSSVSTGNPVLSIRAEKEASVTLSVSNSNGQVLGKKQLTLTKGISTTNLPVMLPASGVYNVTLLYSVTL